MPVSLMTLPPLKAIKLAVLPEPAVTPIVSLRANAGWMPMRYAVVQAMIFLFIWLRRLLDLGFQLSHAGFQSCVAKLHYLDLCQSCVPFMRDLGPAEIAPEYRVGALRLLLCCGMAGEDNGKHQCPRTGGRKNFPFHQNRTPNASGCAQPVERSRAPVQEEAGIVTQYRLIVKLELTRKAAA